MNQDELNSISSYVSKLLRKNFGKGPQSCQAMIQNKLFTIYIRGFISPMEEVLMQQGQRDQVHKARAIIINHILDELKGVVEISLDCEVEERYHDWNFPNNSGLIIFVVNKENKETDEKILSSIDIVKLEEEVARISLLVQKTPDKIHGYPVSTTTYIVERKGILIPIEKALIRKGFEEELRLTKDELEKSYFHKYGKFNEIFNEDIIDIFIDWDFKNDKSLMGFIMNSKKK